MIVVYFERECGFTQRILNAERADISAVGQREVLTIRNHANDAIAQFDMNTVVGWCDDYYDTTDDGGAE